MVLVVTLIRFHKTNSTGIPRSARDYQLMVGPGSAPQHPAASTEGDDSSRGDAHHV